jgi:hypothetical protein
MTVLLLVVAAGLAVIMGMILMPKDLDQIKGYPGELVTGEPRNLLGELQVALNPKEETSELAFTEAEINQYLSQRIGGKQGGPLGALVKYKGLYADLEPNFVELYLVRTVVGLPFTVSCRLTQKKSGYTTVWKAGGGSIGRFRLSSKQFKPIIDAFLRIRGACKDEMDAIKAMNEIKFDDDRIVFSK